MRRDFIPTVQHKVAISALPASALRGNQAGMTAIARDFLRVLDLGQFAVTNPERFNDRLDRATELLLAELRTSSGSWGVARKALNLFLRDSLYNVYLQKRFKLQRAERCFEVPLDGVVAEALRTRFRRALPAWRGVKYLDSDPAGPTRISRRNGPGVWGSAECTSTFISGLVGTDNSGS